MAIKNLIMKIQGQGHRWGQSLKSQLGSIILSTPILWFLVNPRSYCYDRAFQKFDLQNFKAKVIAQCHIVGITSYPLISLSFHVNLPSHSWDTAILKNWPWTSKVKVMGEVEIQSHNVTLLSWTSCRLTYLWFHVKWPSHSWDTAFSKFDLENQRSRS